ncbi:hypothetical protein M23134_00595 [Microscilla marina ATCC 23134]|uniref:Uncharacterized protein n=1 Tax=Microscilla marina ATCC 23134 TaxID=313606 RepID=A1ZY77_MICM2|nr:hypothetical protein M23134_00595 [Microscilla marina ATCC 23134]
MVRKMGLFYHICKSKQGKEPKICKGFQLCVANKSNTKLNTKSSTYFNPFIKQFHRFS